MEQSRKPSATIELIAKVMAARLGQQSADAWLAEQLARPRDRQNLPDLEPASALASTSASLSAGSTLKTGSLRGRLRPLGDILRDNIPAQITPIPPWDEPAPSRPTSPARPQVAPLTAAEASWQLIAGLEAKLHPATFRIFAALHRVALEVAQARGYHPEVSHVTFHCPLEIVAAALSRHRCTIERQGKVLKELGLIDFRPHKTTLRGKVVNSGTLWQVKLNPRQGKSARLSYYELKHPWRDLKADVKAGRTAFRVMRQSKLQRETEVNYQLLLDWSLPPTVTKPPLSMTVARSARADPSLRSRADLETVLDPPHASKQARSALVDTAARAICVALGDQSTDFYRLLLWNLLRRYDQGRDYFQRVYTMLKRVQIDRQEGFARRAGALFIARLKQSGLWKELAETPPNRVSTAPIKA